MQDATGSFENKTACGPTTAREKRLHESLDPEMENLMKTKTLLLWREADGSDWVR